MNRRTWPALLACAWGVVFAIPHGLWGLGLLDESLRFSLAAEAGADEERLIDSARFQAFGLWGVGALCLLSAVIAVFTLPPWLERVPRWMPVVGALGVALVLGIRGLVAPGLFGSLAIELGVIAVPAGSDPAWFRWNLVLWSPWFLIGAVLFGRAALVAWRDADPSLRRHTPGS